ncbi:MAG: ABC transporter permease subunit [Verrucomicrobiales bacterium]|nr:ABC transporter permease subunit [Verrucomicrobiales bacterium]
MADYLVDLCLKYFFRGVLVMLVLAVFIEGLMRLDVWLQGEVLVQHVWQVFLQIFANSGDLDGGRSFMGQLLAATGESLKLGLVAFFLVLAFALPLGLMAGRVAIAPSGWAGLGRWLGRALLLPVMLVKGIPAFALACAVVFSLVYFQHLPVLVLIAKGGVGFADQDAWLAGAWRLLFPASVMALTGIACLAGDVARTLRIGRAASFVAAAEDGAIHGDRLFFIYVVKNSLWEIGSAILRIVPYLMGALILVEWVFGYPGLGSLIRAVAVDKDFVGLLAVGAMSALLVLLACFAVEWVMGAVDKKTRSEGGLSLLTTREMATGSELGRKVVAKRWRGLQQVGGVLLLLVGLLWALDLLVDFSADGEAWRWLDADVRDLLSAASGACFLSVMASVFSVAISFVLAGLLSWLGGWRVYGMLAKVHGAVWTVPVLFWLLAVSVVVGTSFWALLAVLTVVAALLGTGVLSRWFLVLEFQGWVEAARISGLTRGQIFMRHLVPALWLRLWSRMLLLLPSMFLMVVAVDFALFEKGAPSVSLRWGGLLGSGYEGVWQDPRLLFFAIMAVWAMAVFFALLARWADVDQEDPLGLDIF